MYEKYKVGSSAGFTPVNLLCVLIAKLLNKNKKIAAKINIEILIAVHHPKKVVSSLIVIAFSSI